MPCMYMTSTNRGEDHVDTAALHHFLAKAYIGLKDGVAAEKALEEAKRIYEPYGYIILTNFHFS